MSQSWLTCFSVFCHFNYQRLLSENNKNITKMDKIIKSSKLSVVSLKSAKGVSFTMTMIADTTV